MTFLFFINLYLCDVFKIFLFMDFLVNNIMYIAPFLGVIGLVIMFRKSSWVSKQNPGNEKWLAYLIILQKGLWPF